MLISQSLVKDLWKPDICGRFLHFRYIEKKETPGTELMFKGRYFEWHLLGATRDGIEPVFKPLSGGGKPLPQQELDSLIFRARTLMQRMGVKIAEGEKQARLSTDLFEGHLDLITNDFQKPGHMANYDVKYTETKIDDRWNGWADAENSAEVRLQATHYTKLYYDVYGIWIPFYYFVFGKSGWVRVIKIIVTEGGIEEHLTTLQQAADRLGEISAGGWKPKPEFNRCTACPFNAICPDKALLPTVERITF